MERLPVLWGGGEDNGWMKGKGYADEEDRVVNSKHSPSLDFAIRNFVSVEPLYIQISQTTISNRQNHKEHYAGMNSGHDVSPVTVLLGPLVFFPAFQV